MVRLVVFVFVFISTVGVSLSSFNLFGASVYEKAEDKKYRLLSEPVTKEVDNNKIELIEVFWYGCPHCYEMEKIMVDWAKKLPSSVELKKLPVVFGPPWQPHAQLYYSLESLGLVAKMHSKIFDFILYKGERLDTAEKMSSYLYEFDNKIDKHKFVKVYESFGVKNQVQKAYAKTRGAKIEGVPAFILDGRFVVDAQIAGSVKEMFSTIDMLIKMIEMEKQTKK